MFGKIRRGQSSRLEREAQGKGQGKRRYWKNDRNGDGEEEGKSGGNFEMCKMYENFGDWMGTVDGDSVSHRETDRSADSYQEGGGGLT